MDKLTQLKALEAELLANKDLPLKPANLVFGEGNVNTQVMFIGEAPGFHEDQQKRPFVGRGGQLLNECIRGIGWKREDIYITNIVKRRPPDNRDPLPEEIAAYTPYLTRQIEIINPKIIAPLGRFSMNYFLPDAKISRDQGKVFEVGGRLVVPLFHPAAALRATHVLEALKASFQKLPAIASGEYSSVTLPPARAEKPEKKGGAEQPRLF
jgi:DNA polymerase